MKKLTIVVCLCIPLLVGIVSTSLWFYSKKENFKNQADVHQELLFNKVSLFNDAVVHEVRIQFKQSEYWDSLVHYKTQENLFEKKNISKRRCRNRWSIQL